MELQFQKQEIPCLQPVLNQVQNLEQTQELRIPEGMPGVERIVGCWGQVLIRGKEWSRDGVRLSGGVLVWLLYVPEDGTQPRRLETWIPFQMDWDLPDGTAEGTVRFLPLLRFADARSVSAGKVLIRVGIGVLAQCWVREMAEVSLPEQMPEDVELLRETWPVRLPREAGEKAFEMEEELRLPPSSPRPERMVYYRMDPSVSERKVLANKLVFRGSGNLHLLYLGEDGQLHNWDFELPFSQYAQLEGSYSPDAQGDVSMAMTSMELEPDEEGNLRLKAGLTGQYLVDDRQMVETVGDAWSPFRETDLRRQTLQLPAQLDNRRENIYGEQTLPIQADVVTDAVFLPDFPRQRREGDTVNLEQPGMMQLLYYDREGQLQGANQRWEGDLSVQADESTNLVAVPMTSSLQTMENGDSLTVRPEVPVQVQSTTGQGMPMVTGLSLGEKREPDPNRPSLILRRAGDRRLWDIARESGSTVSAIRAANGLDGEPEPGRMLLIPVM